MIKTYKEEIYSRRNKNAIFRLIVFIFSCILYLFFQWYYIKLDIKIDSWNTIKPSLKQFWIVNIRTNINPDNIFINWKNYNNWNKEILDYWRYKIEIYWKDILPAVFEIAINKDYPIFLETINLFKKFKYSKFNSNFDKIFKVDDNYFVFQKNSKIIEVYDKKFVFQKIFTNNFLYIWDKYFSNNWVIYAYDFENNIIKPFKIKEDSLDQTICENPKIIGTKLFCNDNMTFIDWTKFSSKNPIIKVNENIILTSDYIYNNLNLWNWGSYNYKNKEITNPINLVHIDNVPYILEDGYLHMLNNKNKIWIVIPEIQNIKNAIDFSDEVILVWFNWDKKTFLIIDWKKRYTWELWDIDILNLKINKINWVYIFNTWKNLFLYYKWSPNIQNILSWENIKLIDNIAFFNRWDKSYYLNLLQESN